MKLLVVRHLWELFVRDLHPNLAIVALLELLAFSESVSWVF